MISAVRKLKAEGAPRYAADGDFHFDENDDDFYNGQQLVTTTPSFDPDEQSETDLSSEDEDGAYFDLYRLHGGHQGDDMLVGSEDAETGVAGKTGGLGKSSQAMLEKLNHTRAATLGDIQDSQAANNTSGMLMLESIANKADPTSEQADPDEEAMARLANERVKMQEEMEKVRSSFTDLELFHRKFIEKSLQLVDIMA